MKKKLKKKEIEKASAGVGEFVLPDDPIDPNSLPGKKGSKKSN